VIRDVVIHMSGEQPMLADLYTMPSPADVTVICTNLRMKGGQRPVSVDAIDSVFVFPMIHMRFIEVPAGAAGALVPVSGRVEAVGVEAGSTVPSPVGMLESAAGTESPVPEAPPSEPEADLEIDEDFLRRVREI